MDITCRKCGEPWEAAYLRHELAWYICWHGWTVQRWSTGVWHHRKHNHWDAAAECADQGRRWRSDRPTITRCCRRSPGSVSRAGTSSTSTAWAALLLRA